LGQVIFPEMLTTDPYGNLYIADGGDATSATSTGSVVYRTTTGSTGVVTFPSGITLDQPS
jgi:hypothetical protein